MAIHAVGSATARVPSDARVTVVDLWRRAIIIWRMDRRVRTDAGLVAQHIAVLQENGRVGVALGLMRLVHETAESIGHRMRHSGADRGRLVLATACKAESRLV